MTTEQRTARIKALTTELASLYEEMRPPPRVTFISAADLPCWLAEGLRDAIRRKIAVENSRPN
jgi:hypothetical protein